jgi:hypothetical protein
VPRSDRRGPRPLLFIAVLAALWFALSSGPTAHDIPNDVTVRSYVKPEGQRLRLLVRAPLNAMRDIDYPRRGAGYLDLEHADAAIRNAAIVWIADSVKLYEDDTLLTKPVLVAALVALPSDKSFGRYEDAVAHVTGPRLPGDTQLFWQQGLLDVLFEYPIRSSRAAFSIDPGLERLGVRVLNVVRFLPPDGAERAFEFLGNPGLVRLDPRWHQAALRFVHLGFSHILDGIDHLLFLVCLVIPFRRLRALVIVVSSFTLAHSVTLVASAYGFAPDALWFPPLIETLIALSILYMAFENIVGPRLQGRWAIAFGFGLVHGFGFSFALRQTLQFAGSHLLTSLLSFNVGVELGQLLVLVALIPVLSLLFRFVFAERIGTILLSALVGHTAWHWMIDRWIVLRQFSWPTFDAAALASLLRLLILIVVAAGLVWLIFGVLWHRAGSATEDEAAVGADE